MRTLLPSLSSGATSTAVAGAVAGALCAVALSGCSNEGRKESKVNGNNCAEKLSKKQFAAAVPLCEEAVRLWPENHMAAYMLGGAYTSLERWDDAAKAYEKALRGAQNESMYHQKLGITHYKRVIFDATQTLAKAKGKNTNEVEPDLASLNYDPAIQHLETAAKLKPELWNSLYHLGRIFRVKDEPAKTAEYLTKAIQANPYEGLPYIALADLYRQWDYTDQAIQVASQGVQHVVGNEVAQVYYSLGMAYNDKRQDEKAIEAFGSALEQQKDLHIAKFMRGQAYFRGGNFAKAKKDLEEFQKGAGGKNDFAKAQANKTLLDIAFKQGAK